MARIFFLSILLLLTACTIQPGLWTWLHSDARYAERHRAQDIYECEEYAQQTAVNGPVCPQIEWKAPRRFKLGVLVPVWQIYAFCEFINLQWS